MKVTLLDFKRQHTSVQLSKVILGPICLTSSGDLKKTLVGKYFSLNVAMRLALSFTIFYHSYFYKSVQKGWVISMLMLDV